MCSLPPQETPLHKAARFGHELVCILLLQSGSGLLRNAMHMSALDVAGAKEDFLRPPSPNAASAGRAPKAPVSVMIRKRVRKCIMTYMAAARVLVVSHDDCLLHATRHGHQEAPARVKDMMDKIRKASGMDRFERYELQLSEHFELIDEVKKKKEKKCVCMYVWTGLSAMRCNSPSTLS